MLRNGLHTGGGLLPPRRNHKKATSGKGLSSRLSIPLCLCAVTALALLIGLPTSSAWADDLSIKGGDGISGNEPEVNNGSPVNRTEAGTAYGTVTVVGGNGGNGGDSYSGSGGSGGKGGDARLTLSNNAVSVHTLTIQGGNGGHMGSDHSDGNFTDPSNPGFPGHAVVQAKNLSVTAGFSMSGGTRGDGKGGDATFTANTLKTGDIALNKGDGSLNFTVDNALVWTGNGGFTVTGSGATIVINSLTIDGGTVNKDNYDNLISANAYYTTKDITLGSNGATFNTSDSNQSVRRVLTGAGSLTKTGAGTLTLTGNNNYTGGTSINGGTLQIGNGGTSGSITGNIVNNASLVFNRSDDLSHAGSISGAGSLTKTGAGTLTLTGNNTYTGGTRINGGTLALRGGGTLSTSSLLALRGGDLDISAISTGSLSLPDLDVHGPTNLKIGTQTADFSGKTLSFYVPSDMNDGGTLISVSGTGTTEISNSTVQVGIEGASSPLVAGDAITLINVPNGTLQGDPSNTSSKGEGMQGVTLRYEFDLATNGKRLTATVAGAKTDPRAKALSEGFLAGMALNLQGADLVAGRGLDSAVQESSGTDDAEGHGVSGFGALSGGSLRYDSGSHIDMKSLSVLTGLARGVDLKPGRLTTGAFFEYGNGSYDTYNSFSNAASVHGDGHSWYMGVGMLARMDYVDSGRGRYYAEASARVGKTHNKYGSLDLRDAVGRTADYDSSSAYYGLHVGSGYIWNLSEKSSLDVYGKYFWTRQQGDSVGLSTGETLRFEDADSSRLRLGGRFAYTVNERVSTYIGAAWEHEFDGKARATTNGFAIDAPSLRGGSGLCELGLSLRPSADRPLTIDLGVQGYVGKREGVTGSVQVNFEF